MCSLWRVTEQELNEGTRRRPYMSKAKEKSPWPAVTLFYAQFMYEFFNLSNQEKQKGRATLPTVHYQLLLPSHHICLSEPFLPTEFSVVMRFHPYLHCFTLAMVLFPLHFLHPQPPWPSTPLPQTRQASQCLFCSIFHHYGEDVLFTVTGKPAATPSQQWRTAQYSSWSVRVKELQLEYLK